MHARRHSWISCRSSEQLFALERTRALGHVVIAGAGGGTSGLRALLRPSCVRPLRNAAAMRHENTMRELAVRLLHAADTSHRHHRDSTSRREGCAIRVQATSYRRVPVADDGECCNASDAQARVFLGFRATRSPEVDHPITATCTSVQHLRRLRHEHRFGCLWQCGRCQTTPSTATSITSHRKQTRGTDCGVWLIAFCLAW